MSRPSPAVAAVLLLAFALFQLVPYAIPSARAADGGGGILSVTANVEGAKVTVDGEPAGVTPLTALFPPGLHRVRVEAPGHDSASREVRVEAGKKVLFEATLVRVASVLDVRVNVEGAAAFLDDRPIGTGGRIVIDPIDPGTCVLRVEKPGFETWQGKVTVFRSQIVALPVELASAFGTLSVQSLPPGAKLWVDGQPRGVTPLTLEGLSHGLHSVRLAHPGHADVFQSVRVDRRHRASLDVEMPTRAGRLVVRASPGKPRLSIDGYDLGEHGEIALDNVSVGIHQIRASLPGHADAMSPVQVLEGQEAALALRLAPVGTGSDLAGATVVRPPARRALPWVILGVAVAAGAGIGIGLAAGARAASVPGETPVTPPAATVGVALP